MLWFKKKPELPPQSSIKPEEFGEQLRLLQEVTKTTGVLHEAQRIQLDYWIRVVLDKAKNHTLILDLTGPHKSITFDVVTKGKQKDLESRLRPLDEWVKWLLGDHIAVRVKINGDLVWEQGPREK